LAKKLLYHNLATRRICHLKAAFPPQVWTNQTRGYLENTCDEWLVGGIPLKIVVFPLKIVIIHSYEK